MHTRCALEDPSVRHEHMGGPVHKTHAFNMRFSLSLKECSRESVTGTGSVSGRLGEWHRVLTVETQVCGGAPELSEGLVRLQALSKVLNRPGIQLVATETANDGTSKVSPGIDSSKGHLGRRTQRR